MTNKVRAKVSNTETRQAEIEAMTDQELEAFTCERLYTLFRAFPTLAEWQRREALEIVCKLEYMAPPAELDLWNRIVDHFKRLAAACKAAANKAEVQDAAS